MVVRQRSLAHAFAGAHRVLPVAGLIGGPSLALSCPDQFQELIMKKLLIGVMGALTLGAGLPAFAKPDFQAIERARRAQQAAQGEFQGASYQVSPPPAAEALKCPPDRMELAIDRGPRSLMPSPQNRLRWQRYEAQVKACKDAAR